MEKPTTFFGKLSLANLFRARSDRDKDKTCGVHTALLIDHVSIFYGVMVQ